MLSVIIPTYNESKDILACLLSLQKQTYPDFEIIVVDDGSSDDTIEKIRSFKSSRPLTLLTQSHLGPGAARNLGAQKARGEVLVFVDADMTFDTDFLSALVTPILAKKTIGTFSKDEFLENTDSPIARCWNRNLGRKVDQMIPSNYPDTAPVFRAIITDKFHQAGGFDTKVGYTDDWSISKKLGVSSTTAPSAKFYHKNPSTLAEVWRQARWFGKNEFLTGNLIRRAYNLFRYFPLLSPIKGLVGTIFYREPQFLPFKLVFDSAVFASVLLSFLREQKNK